MKRVLSLLFLVVACKVSVGQDDSVFTSYKEQYVRLSKEYAQSPDNVANLMDMAAFYSQPENPYNSLTLAAEYAKRAEVLYTAWVQDKGRYRDMQKLIRKGITIPVIRQRRKDIEAQAVLYVRSHVPQIDEAEAAALMETFPDNAEMMKRLRAKVLSDAYEKVRNENTIKGYYTFIQSHPNTVEADSAEVALARLAPRYVSQFVNEASVDSAVAAYLASASLQQAGMRQKSRIAYWHASQINSEDAYSRYLERYPRGDYYMEALERLQQLRNDAFGTLVTPEELAEYAQSHGDEPLADSALARLRNMVTQERSQRAAHIYLSQFSLDQEYSSVYRQYYEWYAEEGNGEPIRTFVAENPNYPYKMAFGSDLARAAIIDSIDLTKSFQEADYEQMETNVRLLMGRKAAFVALQRILQQQIVHKDWTAARNRMQKFDLCFEDVCSGEYEELAKLLTDNTGVVARREVGVDSITRQLVHPTDNYLCFSYTRNGHSSIGYARMVKKGKTNIWQHLGEINVEGSTSTVVPYCFYDKGSMVLLGIAGDIWSAEVVSDSVWQLHEHFGSPVNTPYIEQDAYMLEDGTGMLLVSDRPGGLNVQKSGSYYHGDNAPAFDIYYIPLSTTASSAQWGEAVNLGQGVNTPYCERSPILSRNMRTLYYVTDAHGLGYGDVYRVTRSDIDDWTHWSKPVNLGRGVNGAFGESSLSFGNEEKRVYYTAGVQPNGKSVCQSFVTQHDTARASRQIVVDMEEVADVLRRVDVLEVWRQRPIDCLMGRQLDTLYIASLYRDKPYALLAEADWIYVPTVSIIGGTQDSVVLQGYTLEQLRNQLDSVPLLLTTFQGNTAQMQPFAKQELKVLAHFILQHAGCQVELLSHVRTSDDRAAYTLSLQRATAVRNFLVGCGVAADRIRISAYGNVVYKQGQASVPMAVRFL